MKFDINAPKVKNIAGEKYGSLTMEDKLREMINIYKAMIKAYDELMEEGDFAKPILQAKKGTMLMVIEDLENLLKVGDKDD